MPASEFAAWDAYVDLYGPLDIRQRIDHAAARVASTVANVNGARIPYRQFLDFPPPPPVDDSDMSSVDKQFLAALDQPGQNIVRH